MANDFDQIIESGMESTTTKSALDGKSVGIGVGIGAGAFGAGYGIYQFVKWVKKKRAEKKAKELIASDEANKVTCEKVEEPKEE